MKTVITLFVALLSLTVIQAQNNTLDTQSVRLDDLISFIANYFPATNSKSAKAHGVEAKVFNRKITFLVETTKKNFSTEDKIILQQAFKFLTKRLSKSDLVTIVVYSGQNGLLLDKASGKNIKKILHAISNVRNNMTQKQNDGIALAYQMAQDKLDNQSLNTLVMVRNPNASSFDKIETTNTESELVNTATTKKSKGNNVLLLTAIAVLPELISIIKD
ncbi:hypothetical protein [Lacinutrix sp. Hel_I_90]|uniref:hypothetical protein n=1 Tax=Lacinutrix sp. Hel_I_90 TaxID=1249999 RepID=UPI0005C97120|nr:hypothetical protein [Lacinutrix sp. Hel_I_90]